MAVFDAAYKTPLMIRDPNNQSHAGSVISVPTESIDITPTILDWVGQPIPNSMDGRSLLPLMQGQIPDDWRSYSFSELDFAEPEQPTIWQQVLGTGNSDSCLGILRDERFTLVEFAADLPPMLFDQQDGGELRNKANDPECMSVLMRLSRQMLRHRMQNMDHTLSLDSITADGPKTQPRY
jgi:arylsulfatase A-like enzyme